MNAQTKRRFKNALFEQFARVGKALSSGRRLEIVDVLAQGERSVEEIAVEAQMPIANASQHLRILLHAHLVETRREGTYIYYRLAEGVSHLWLALRKLGEQRLAEVERLVTDYLRHRRELSAVSQQELRRRMKQTGVVVLDVRPMTEFHSGHIAGAQSLPLNEVRARLRELPKNRMIVAYCRGPYCVFADDAVALLRSRGYQALRLEGGFPEWQASGLPVEANKSVRGGQERN